MPRYDLRTRRPSPCGSSSASSTRSTSSATATGCRLPRREGLTGSKAELARAGAVREAIRELLYANNRQRVEGDPHAVLREAARRARFTLDLERPELVADAPGVDGLIGRVLATAYVAMADGTWARLKACRNHGCRWAFYDYSKNRSASWCSMQLCGNRTKTRSYRRRHAPA